ncbi:O-antigen ligase family protein [Sphingomonas sp. 22L2VL55-3]
MITNIISIIVVPHIALNFHPDPILNYQWRGLMGDKNAAGATSALTIIIVAFSVKTRKSFSKIVILSPLVIFLLCSLSRTAIISLIVALCVSALVRYNSYRISRMYKSLGSTKVALLLCVPCLVFISLSGFVGIFPEAISPFFTDQSIVSNRGAIWWPLIQAFSESPFFGVGYGAFWGIAEVGGSVSPDRAHWINTVSQAHNGYLNLLLEIGLIGLAAALYAAFVDPVSKILSKINSHSDEVRMVVCLLTFCLISNGAESGFMELDNVWSIFLVIALALAHNTGRKITKRRRGSVNLVDA